MLDFELKEIVAELGTDGTVTEKTGTSCPCLIAGNGYYSPEWHDNNLTATDCKGTGLIGTVVKTEKVVRAILVFDIGTLQHYYNNTALEAPGFQKSFKAAMVAPVIEGELINLSLHINTDKVTFSSVDYKLVSSYISDNAWVGVLQ